MDERSETNDSRPSLRDKIIGLGERSMRKSYYPQLQQQLEEVEGSRIYLEEKSAALLNMLEDLEEGRKKLVASEAQLRTINEELEQRVAERTAQLEVANRELEAFAYSVSHDLRAPLRAIDGFCQIILEDYAAELTPHVHTYLTRMSDASQRMRQLIDDLLRLSRVTRTEMTRTAVDLSAVAQTVADEFRAAQPQRQIEFVIAPGLVVHADPNLLRIIFENLLGNAIKFTGRHPTARIEVGCKPWPGCGEPKETAPGADVYFVRDDGAGFDPAYAGKLFAPFQRLHSTVEFDGTGIGLATVQRIIHRHGGRVWAEGAVEQGATFYFTLG